MIQVRLDFHVSPCYAIRSEEVSIYGVKPNYEDAHLIVAAVRILSYKLNKPPLPEEVASLLGMPPDFVRNLVISLRDNGILKLIESPFEIRAEIGDHLKIEELPRASEVSTIKDEIEEFVKKRKQKIEETEKMLDLKEMEKRKKEKISKIEDEIKKFKGKRPPISFA